MQAKRLVHKSKSGEIQKVFGYQPGQLKNVRVVYREDIRKLEINSDETALKKKGIPFLVLGESDFSEIQNKPLLFGELGHLELLENPEPTVQENTREDKSYFGRYLIAFMFLIVLPVALSTQFAYKPVAFEEKMQEQVVKIVERAHKKEIQKSAAMTSDNNTEVKTAKPVTKTQSVKRVGALAVLGQLSKGANKGGLNLGAATTTAGPGLGGSEGSGGVQTSLYGKGLQHAALGAGARADGGGGIGTKGKGGGQAGYGTMSLVGSTGVETVNLSQEATIEGGLDRDAINAVIQRNMGQIRFCYEMGLQSEASLSGRVLVDFTISPQGMVSASSVAHSTLKSDQAESCILMRLRSWKFPLPKGDLAVKVSYPFMFKRVGS